jgi:hypothetical protein
MAKRSTKSCPLTVWVVTAVSESADHYGPEVYTSKPSDETLKTLCESWDAGDWDGHGDYNSYCHLEVTECPVQ